jgi:cysteinyl-tRNA synthetase
MGQPRFKKLASLLPSDVSILGLDEHTACIMELERQEAEVKGLGRIILRHGDSETTFEKGDRFPLDILRESARGTRWVSAGKNDVEETKQPRVREGFWQAVHYLEKTFRHGLKHRDFKATTGALLELDRMIWQAQTELEDEETISEAREVLRDLLVLIGSELDDSTVDRSESLASIVDPLLALRATFRKTKQWEAADSIRDALMQAHVIIEDTQDGTRWRLAT